MTRKDYELIARAVCAARMQIANVEPDECMKDLQDGVSYAVDYIGDALAAENPRFDKDKFHAACGVQS